MEEPEPQESVIAGEGREAGQLGPLSIQASALVRSIDSLSRIFWISFGGTFLSVFFAGLSQLDANATTDHFFLGEYQVPKSILPLVSVAFAGFVFWLTANRLNMLHHVLQTTQLSTSAVHEIFRLNPPVLHVFDANNIKRWSPTTGVGVFIINWAIFFGNSIALTWASALQAGASLADFHAPMLFIYLLFIILVLVYGFRAIVPSLGEILQHLHGLHFTVGWPRHLVAVALVVLVFIINQWDQVTWRWQQPEVLLGPDIANAINGETLLLRGTEVKLFGMDAVEADQSCQDAEGADYPCGRLATHALQALLQRRQVICLPLFAVNAGRVLGACELLEEGQAFPMGARELLTGTDQRQQEGSVVEVFTAADFMGGGSPNSLSRLMIAKGHALGVGMGAEFFWEEQSNAQRQRLGIWQGAFQPPSVWRRR